MIWFLIAIFASLCLVFLILVLKLFSDCKNSNEEISKISQKPINLDTKNKPNIDELLVLANDNKTSKNELFTICKFFVENITLAPKNGDNLTDEARKFLSFISLIAKHKNSNAKLITFLTINAKKKNPTFEYDIENYESQGLQSRKSHKKR